MGEKASELTIHLPSKVNWASVNRLMRIYVSADEYSTCRFDWTRVTRVYLPAVVAVLNWSTSLAKRHSIEWILPETRRVSPCLNDLRAKVGLLCKASLVKAADLAIQELRGMAKRQSLFPRQHKITLDEWRTRLTQDSPTAVTEIEGWLDRQAYQFRQMDVLGFLERFDVFARARESRVQLLPDSRELLMTCFATKADCSANVALLPLRSINDLDTAVRKFADPVELQKLLGRYAGMDVVRSGAMSRLLIAELGRNIEEHARSTFSAICTRLVSGEELTRYAGDDPALRPFATTRNDVLEVTLVDNGVGLINTHLEEVLKADQRSIIQSRYRLQPNGHYLDQDLVDYAFERLSSTKRDIAQMVHCDQEAGTSELVASGLFWVWNLVRSHGGVIAVRSGSVDGYYDLTPSAVARAYARGVQPLLTASKSAAIPGTMIRVFFPVTPGESRSSTNLRKRPLVERSGLAGLNVRVVWAGDVVQQIHRFAEQSSQPAPGFNDHAIVYTKRVLQELKSRIGIVAEGDILLLDLCGVREHWLARSAAAIYRFFVEMNYTSIVGRSTVVLWNVPLISKGLFQQAMEQVAARHPHLRALRRIAVMIWEDGSVEFVHSTPESAPILQRLASQPDADPADIGLTGLGSGERSRVEQLLYDNPQVFDFPANGRIRFRIDPQLMRERVWERSVEWLKQLIRTGVNDGGILLRDKAGYFQLPSTGRLVREFFQFSAVLPHAEVSARLAWMSTQVVEQLLRQQITRGTPVRWLVSVTRSTAQLLRAIAAQCLPNEPVEQRPSVVAGSTVEEIEQQVRTKRMHGPAILFTDVISSGTLCSQVARVLPDVNWVGTVAMLDTRPDAPLFTSSLRMASGIEVLQSFPVKTGPTYVLVRRRVVKSSPSGVGNTAIRAIDPVNVCLPSIEGRQDAVIGNIWRYLEPVPGALHVGYLRAGDYRRYIYYVDVKVMLQAVDSASGSTPLGDLIKRIQTDLGKDYNPDQLAVAYPLGEVSCAEEIARAVQGKTGALYVSPMHRELCGEQCKCSVPVRLGDGRHRLATLIIVDDGCNTGETLLGLLAAGSTAAPCRILCYSGLSRMPLHKAQLFQWLSRGGADVDFRVGFLASLAIPVFTSQACPITRLRRSLKELGRLSSLLRRFTDVLYRDTSPEDVGALTSSLRREFPWSFASNLTVARLRETIELARYHQSVQDINTVLTKATIGNEEGAESILQDLAFIVCAEPELAELSMFADFAQKLVQKVTASIGTCSQSNILALMGLAYQFLVRQEKTQTCRESFDQGLEILWRGVLSNNRLTVEILGKILTIALADALIDDEASRHAQKRVCHEWSKALLHVCARRSDEKAQLLTVCGRFYAREIAMTLQGMSTDRREYQPLESHGDLYTLASVAARRFWSHAQVDITQSIDRLEECLSQRFGRADCTAMEVANDLIVAFEHLRELQQELEVLEREQGDTIKETAGVAKFWSAPELAEAMGAFGNALFEIAEYIEDHRTASRQLGAMSSGTAKLAAAWGTLKQLLVPALGSIFVDPAENISSQLSEWPTITGLSLDRLDTARMHDHQVSFIFLPQSLLRRFLDVSFQNLKTAAFHGWPLEELANAAKVAITVEPITAVDERRSSGKRRWLSIRIIDNGATRPHAQAKGHGRGLADLQRLVAPFGARLLQPQTTSDGNTVIELQVLIWDTKKRRPANA